MDAYLGEIKMFGGNFAPRGFALCNGQLLSIAQNTALFSLLGTTYGGNGQTTFALPDLRARVPMHFGQGPGLSNRSQGEMGGTETVTLIQNELPAHNHLVRGVDAEATSTNPEGKTLATVTDATANTMPTYANTAPAVSLHPQTLTNSGGNQPHNNMQPYLVINFIIALEGIFPSRN